MKNLKHQPQPPEGVEQNVNGLRDVLKILHYALESRWSTISVRDLKTKFTQIRCYVDLADEARVWEEWKLEGNSGPPTSEFKLKCLVRDCGVYRSVYRYLLKSSPNLWRGLYYGADYPGLLAETREGLDELLDSERYSGVPWDLEYDRELLYKICEFEG